MARPLSATGPGRYAFQVTVDAFSEEFDDEIWPFTEPAEEGAFAAGNAAAAQFAAGKARQVFLLLRL